MIWCRCNAHLVESDDDQTPDETCCVCRGKRLQAARWRWYAAGHINAEKRAAQRVPAVAPLMSICHPTMPDGRHGVNAEKPNAPDYSEASTGTLGLLPSAALRAPRGTSRSPDHGSARPRDVKPENTPPRAAGGSDGDRLQA